MDALVFPPFQIRLCDPSIWRGAASPRFLPLSPDAVRPACCEAVPSHAGPAGGGGIVVHGGMMFLEAKAQRSWRCTRLARAVFHAEGTNVKALTWHGQERHAPCERCARSPGSSIPPRKRHHQGPPPCAILRFGPAYLSTGVIFPAWKHGGRVGGTRPWAKSWKSALGNKKTQARRSSRGAPSPSPAASVLLSAGRAFFFFFRLRAHKNPDPRPRPKSCWGHSPAGLFRLLRICWAAYPGGARAEYMRVPYGPMSVRSRGARLPLN